MGNAALQADVAAFDAAAAEAQLRIDIERAHDVAELARAARGIAGLAGAVLASTPGACATTALISSLNDEVTRRVVHAVAAQMGVDLAQACWLCFGSQARGEQTIATDQDNGLVFAGDDGQAERPRWMAFGQRVNEALAACGYPLCQGRVMAGQPLCCLTAGEWCRRFEHWMAHGGGNDLFAARIYFDLRPLAGHLLLAQPLLDMLVSPAASVPRFIKQMAEIVLCNHVPLNWLGGIVTSKREGRAMFDLKMSGTALFVDAARLWALAHRIAAPGTVPRLQAAARALHVPPAELAGWLRGFDQLQRLRLQVQSKRHDDADSEERTWVEWEGLDAAQRQSLKQALRAAREVQQRITLDYCR